MTTPNISVTNVRTDHPYATLVPGDYLTARWDTSGDTAWDSCYAAVRSFEDPNAIFTDVYPHPQCGSGEATFELPKEPKDSMLQYNGSMFMVRINTPYGTFSDSDPF
ncbi:hypothetical protein BGZ80_008251, partial [Entomortierella chlamydospora]